MKKVIALYSEKENIPMSKRQLRVAAYCRVSTEYEGQDGSIELQEQYFQNVIDGNAKSVGRKAERGHAPAHGLPAGAPDGGISRTRNGCSSSGRSFGCQPFNIFTLFDKIWELFRDYQLCGRCRKIGAIYKTFTLFSLLIQLCRV